MFPLIINVLLGYHYAIERLLFLFSLIFVFLVRFRNLCLCLCFLFVYFLLNQYYRFYPPLFVSGFSSAVSRASSSCSSVMFSRCTRRLLLAIDCCCSDLFLFSFFSPFRRPGLFLWVSRSALFPAYFSLRLVCFLSPAVRFHLIGLIVDSHLRESAVRSTSIFASSGIWVLRSMC